MSKQNFTIVRGGNVVASSENPFDLVPQKQDGDKFFMTEGRAVTELGYMEKPQDNHRSFYNKTKLDSGEVTMEQIEAEVQRTIEWEKEEEKRFSERNDIVGKLMEKLGMVPKTTPQRKEAFDTVFKKVRDELGEAGGKFYEYMKRLPEFETVEEYVQGGIDAITELEVLVEDTGKKVEANAETLNTPVGRLLSAMFRDQEAHIREVELPIMAKAKTLLEAKKAGGKKSPKGKARGDGFELPPITDGFSIEEKHDRELIVRVKDRLFEVGENVQSFGKLVLGELEIDTESMGNVRIIFYRKNDTKKVVIAEQFGRYREFSGQGETLTAAWIEANKKFDARPKPVKFDNKEMMPRVVEKTDKLVSDQTAYGTFTHEGYLNSDSDKLTLAPSVTVKGLLLTEGDRVQCSPGGCGSSESIFARISGKEYQASGYSLGEAWSRLKEKLPKQAAVIEAKEQTANEQAAG